MEQNNDVPVQISMDADNDCGYQCGICCADCMKVENFENCKCNLGTTCSFLGILSWFISMGMGFFGLIFFCCDRGRISTRTGSCNFFCMTVAPSIFTFLMAASTATIGTAFFLVVLLMVLLKKWGPNLCRQVCRCKNFAHGLEIE